MEAASHIPTIPFIRDNRGFRLRIIEDGMLKLLRAFVAQFPAAGNRANEDE
jgi:hypothetical protein